MGLLLVLTGYRRASDLITVTFCIALLYRLTRDDGITVLQ